MNRRESALGRLSRAKWVHKRDFKLQGYENGFFIGGWKHSGFGDLNQHGPDSIRFYIKTKTVTSRWPSGIKAGASFVMPTMS